jgi:hypothetical protein
MLNEERAMKPIPLLSMVAVVEDVPEHKLTRGQMGTVVEDLGHGPEGALFVEFSDQREKPYAMVPLKPNQLIMLHRKTAAA